MPNPSEIWFKTSSSPSEDLPETLPKPTGMSYCCRREKGKGAAGQGAPTAGCVFVGPLWSLCHSFNLPPSEEQPTAALQISPKLFTEIPHFQVWTQDLSRGVFCPWCNRRAPSCHAKVTVPKCSTDCPPAPRYARELRPLDMTAAVLFQLEDFVQPPVLCLPARFSRRSLQLRKSPSTRAPPTRSFCWHPPLC